jgi:hypothetical protein
MDGKALVVGEHSNGIKNGQTVTSTQVA